MFSLACDYGLWWKVLILRFFEREKSVCSRQFALHQGNLLLPGVGNKLHVLEVPVIILDADSGGSCFEGSLSFQPLSKFVGGFLGSRNVRLQFARDIARHR